jgi:hypothetical protein
MGLVGLTVACSAAPPASTYGGRAKGNDDGDDATDGNNGQFGGDGSDAPAPSTTAPAAASEVWSHSADTLYRLDPVTKAVTVVGRFTGCTNDVKDIALDAQSNIFATTDDALYRIDRKTAACTRVANGQFTNSLSFVPKGTVDPNEEALVGYQPSGAYIRIDTKTGAISTIGALGNPNLESSGDIVSVIDGPTFLTVYGTGCADCLVEVNPKTGAITKNWGPISRDYVFGIAFWAGSVYAFDFSGSLFELSFTGGKLGAKEIPIPNKAPGLEFWGAGSTTSAPVSATR